MKNELVRTSSTVGESNLHLQITPAYRQDVFVDKEVFELTKKYILEKSEKLGLVIPAIDFGPDHGHVFISNWKKHSIEKIAKELKGYSSYMMRKNHMDLIKDKLWGKKFWSEGYFYRTVGAVTKESMQFYIEHSQKKHWKAVDYQYYKYEKEQLRLTSFN